LLRFLDTLIMSIWSYDREGIMDSTFAVSIFSGLLKNTVIKGLEGLSQKSYEDIFEKTLREFESKYFGLSGTDFKCFLKSAEAIKCFEDYDDRNNLDIKCLARILKNYVSLPKGVSAEILLRKFIESLEYNCIQCPELQAKMIFMNLKREDYKLNRILTEMPKYNEISDVNKALIQILNEVRQPQIDGKTLTGNFHEDAEFFKKCMQKLNENQFFKYNVQLNPNDENPRIELIPKQPLRGTITVKLEQKNGKICTLEEILQEAYYKSESVVIGADSIQDISVYVGDTKLSYSVFKFDHIKLTPIPKKAVKICVPGCHISYIVKLHREKGDAAKCILSNNKYQDIPIKFKFEFEPDPCDKTKLIGTGRYSMHLELERMDVNEALQFFEFLKAMIKYKTIDIKNLDDNALIFRGESVKISDSKSIPQSIMDTLRKLCFIQEKTSIRIPFPLTMSDEDLSSIEETFSYFRDGETELNLMSMNIKVSAENAESLLGKIDSDDVIRAMITIETDWSSNFCGVTIPLGSAYICCSSLRIRRPIEALRNELSKLTDGAMDIELVPNDEKIMLTQSKGNNHHRLLPKPKSYPQINEKQD
jgi:hypothetical protein